MARPSSQDPRTEVVTDRSSGRKAPAGPPTPATQVANDDPAEPRSDRTEQLPTVETEREHEPDPLWGAALTGTAAPPVAPAPARRPEPSPPSPTATPAAKEEAPPKTETALEPPPDPVPGVVRRPVVVGRRRRPRVRRVTRVVRAVDTWSVFKVSILFFVLIYLSTLLSGVLLWNVAYVTGTVDNVERFLESFGWETFEFNGGQIYRAGWVIGLFLVVGLTGLTVLAATTFNLIADLVGGVRVTVLEEEVVVRAPASASRTSMRRAEPAPTAETADVPPPSG